MAASPKRRRSTSKMMALWHLALRAVNMVVALTLFLIASLQVNRPDAVMWGLLFLVPAALTFVLSIKPGAVNRVEMNAVSSVCVGCCLCVLIYLGVCLLRLHSRDADMMEMVNAKGADKILSSPFEYPQTWEMLATIVVMAWIKFLNMNTYEALRECGEPPVEVSSTRMLWALVLVVSVLLGTVLITLLLGQLLHSLPWFSQHYIDSYTPLLRYKEDNVNKLSISINGSTKSAADLTNTIQSAPAS